MRFEVEQEMFVSREEGVKRGSLCTERTCFAPTSVTAESSRCNGKIKLKGV